MSDIARFKTPTWVGKVLPGLAPERTRSGVRIDVNSSGTTSISDHDALVKIALERFSEMRECPTKPDDKTLAQL